MNPKKDQATVFETNQVDAFIKAIKSDMYKILNIEIEDNSGEITKYEVDIALVFNIRKKLTLVFPHYFFCFFFFEISKYRKTEYYTE